MEIKKLNVTEETENIEVKGQGCLDDCKIRLTSTTDEAGCATASSAVITGLF